MAQETQGDLALPRGFVEPFVEERDAVFQVGLARRRDELEGRSAVFLVDGQLQSAGSS